MTIKTQPPEPVALVIAVTTKHLIMKTILKGSLSLAALLLALFVPAATSGTNATVIASVGGGGIGRFVATPESLTTSGVSEFAVNIRIRSDGTAVGEFVCAVQGLVVFSGAARTGHLNGDGSVTVFGVECGYDKIAKSGYTGCHYSVVLHPGGPGQGYFTFRDCVFGPGQFDTEVVRVGLISVVH
jgi:hypothetical protein